MIFVWVNLVTYRFFLDRSNDFMKFHVDSISLYILLRIFGIRCKRESTVKFLNSRKFEYGETLILGSYDAKYKFELLPFFNKQVYVTEELFTKIEQFSNIVITISGGKQEFLAELIISRYPNKSIYCIGAAHQVLHNNGTNYYDKFGLNFFYFAILNPKRAYSKMRVTLFEFICILFNLKGRRTEFKKFIGEVLVKNS